MDFNPFKIAIARQFERMQKHTMLRSSVEKDELWTTYLGAFPEGTNPHYRERTEHDCNCCKQFIRAVGNALAVIDGEIVSIWDVKVPSEPGYEAVAQALSALVKSKPIADHFLHYERTAGTDKNFEQMTERVQTWTHFFVNISNQYVAPKANIPTILGTKRADHDVLLRSLTEITDDAIDTVLDLISQNSLYRGAEHKAAILEFQKLKKQFNQLPTPIAKDTFAWTAATFGAVARIRNTSIGTLLVDLSKGIELEEAVKVFEIKVAGPNYKRPTAIVSKAMIEKAKQTLESMGLISALERRYATLNDISVNNILFADRSAKATLAGDVFEELAGAVGTKAKNFDKVEEVHIDKFIKDIVPRISSMEVMLENRHQNNLVSLIAPVDPTAGDLFKWNNKFSWSYNGDMADAIKERVKQAGGNVTGDLCCRLAWYNYDDLDLHMKLPGGAEICFSCKSPHGRGRGELDVDMNAGSGTTRTPVENIFFADRSQMKEGTYHLFVHNWAKRETVDVGFEAQIDYLGQVYQFAYDKAIHTGRQVTIAKFSYSHKDGLKLIESLPMTQASRSMWNIPTQSFHKVSVMMLSPNYWDEQGVGNKHYFFMLEGCRNDGSARGFFNEFLKGELDPHRKVFEMIGTKMKTDNDDSQLSGLGFSSTRQDTLICRVKGSFTRTIKITF